MTYFLKIIKTRYFWWYLAKADIKFKYRRSYLGVLWSVFQPLGLTLLLTFVMGRIFNVNMKIYAPFIFSGMVIWEYVTGSAVMGCNSFVNAESYIKQYNNPLAIYSLRNSLAGFFNFLIAFSAVIIWCAVVNVKCVNLSWLSFIYTLPLLLFITWPLVTICAFIGVQFRDFSQLITLILQALWYASPVFFLPSIFKNAGVGFLLDYNPIAHMLNLVRSPLLEGEFPSLISIAWTFGMIVVLYLIMAVFILKQEKKVIYYL